MDLAWQGLAFAVFVNLIMFIPAFIYKTDKLTDISYAVSFILVAAFGFLRSNQQPLDTLLFAMVTVWAARLGGFLFLRIQNMKRDKRFDGRREHFGKFLNFWILQGLTVGVVLTASLLAFSNRNDKLIGATAIIGIIVFLTGLLLESTADAQKYKFNQSGHSNQWIDKGVWRISRHPNYLGEMLVWIGVYLAAIGALNPGHRIFGLISPLFIIFLLLFVSGIPLLEKAANKKWGSNKDYLAYKKSVPVLLPTLSSIRRLNK